MLMTEMSSVGQDNQDKEERALKIKQLIEQTLKENEEMLNRLGSDYDVDGTPYWDKYEERLRYMEENGI